MMAKGKSVRRSRKPLIDPDPALGAEVRDGGVRFRVWAPKRHSVDVVFEDGAKTVPLEPEGNGYFSGMAAGLAAGTLYRYCVDGGQAFPDPCSRYQPQGPHGPSMVVDPSAFRWRDAGWRGVVMAGQVMYELHVGVFTPEGTLDAAARQLEELTRIGVTLIELMPLAEFPGRWNWGYDGVDLFAPAHVYGDPDALKRFVDAAHALGLGVILDVVYNHLGPDGNYFNVYSDQYFTHRHATDWGDAINYDGPGSKEVREFFIRNACYWISEFHMDGLRLDATQNIYDDGPVHILAELSERARASAAPRTIVLIAENEPQDVRLITPVSKGGLGLDAIWNDDFHHCVHVALTGQREAYYRDYHGEAQELVSSVKRGFLYQGQRSVWWGRPRGTPVTTEAASAFVLFTQNHDQVSNHLRGERLQALTSPSRYRALTALMLLAPETPLLFMGQEFGASSPFPFFADHCEDDLAEKVYEGRKQFLGRFPSYALKDAQAQIPNPCAESTFWSAKLDFTERTGHADMYRFHQDLLRIRRTDPIIAAQDRQRLDGAVLGPQAVAIRFFGPDGDDRLLVVNLGTVESVAAAEPLLAPSPLGEWRMLCSSDDPCYGGTEIINPCGQDGWRLAGGSAVLFAAGRE